MNHPFSIGDSFTREGVSERVYTFTTISTILTVFTSTTLPEAGQKASEAAFTDSTEENESLTLKLIHNHSPSIDITSNLRKLNVHNIAKRMLSIISDSNSSGLSSSELFINFTTKSYLNPLVILREIGSERTSSKSARRKKSLRSESDHYESITEVPREHVEVGSK